MEDQFGFLKINERLKKLGTAVMIGEGVDVRDLDIPRGSFEHSQFSASEKSAERARC